MIADMQELIERIEAGPVYLTHKEAYDLAIFFGSDTALGMASMIRKAFAGGSLDAALALAERVLAEQAIGGRPGRLHDFAQHFNGRWEAKTYRVSDGSSHQSVAATPALALCIAILKAKAQGAGG